METELTKTGAAEASGEPPKKNRNVFYVGLLSFFGGISQDTFSPILPIYYTTVLGFDKTFVGVAEGLVTASSYVFSVVSGLVSDKFKKQKPIIFIGYFFSMVSRPLLAFFTSSPAVLGLRFMDGTGKGIKDPPKDVLIAGSAKKEVRGKSFGIARMLDTLGSVAGPLILFGLLYFLNGSASLYHYILLFTAVPLVITLAILVTKIKEVEHTAPAAGAAAAPTNAPLPATFFLFLGIVILFTLGNSSDAFLILRAKSLGVTLLEIPLVIALFNFIYAMFAVPLGSLSDRIGRIPTMLIGWAAYALVYLGFALASHAYLIWLLYGSYGIYYAANLGVAKAFLADIVGPGNRGKAFGIYGTAVGLATLPASFFAGFLWDKFGPQYPFYFGAAMAAIAAIVLLAFSKKLSEK
ncbi:MAG TPA: MFS transporter [Candidatus Paceibacterota bacterium]|nr:MFS transporter [Candidatus Paceibacterota bacterium]